MDGESGGARPMWGTGLGGIAGRAAWTASRPADAAAERRAAVGVTAGGQPPKSHPAGGSRPRRPSLGGGQPAQGRELGAQGRKTVRRLLEAGLAEFDERGFQAVRVDVAGSGAGALCWADPGAADHELGQQLAAQSLAGLGGGPLLEDEQPHDVGGPLQGPQVHVVGDAVVGAPERLTGDDLLGFAGIEPATVLAIAKAQQFAEKVHAYTFPWAGRVNTRHRALRSSKGTSVSDPMICS